MLDSADRARIRAEEVFRAEVRRQLDAQRPMTWSRRAWDFANSSLGMWLLTTVLVGGATWAFATWRESERVAAARRTNITRLDLEIATRLDRLAIRLPRLQRAQHLAVALDALDRPRDNVYASSAYPEYARRSLLSLLRELRDELQGTDASELDLPLRAGLQLARIGVASVEPRLDSAAGQRQVTPDTFAVVVSLIDDSLRTRRWIYVPVGRVR